MRIALACLGYLIVLIFLGKFAYSSKLTIDEANMTISVSYFLSAFLIIFLAFFFQVAAWKKTFSMYGIFFSYSTNLNIYTMAVLSAYIPGKIPGIIITANAAAKMGASRVVASIAMLVYQLMSLISAGTLAVIIFVFVSQKQTNSIFIMFLIFIISSCLLLIRQNTLNWLMKSVMKLFKRGPHVAIEASYQQKVALFSLFFVAWSLVSCAIGLLYCAIADPAPINVLMLISAIFLVSQISGSLIFILPSGMGVYEIIFYFSLVSFFPEKQLIALVALSRVLLVSPSILVYVITSFWLYIQYRRDRKRKGLVTK
jgi:uncharacterized membrane protein YbhN (UPF0104 family)